MTSFVFQKKYFLILKKTFILSKNTYDITHSNCDNLYVDEQTFKQIVEYFVARVKWPFKDE